MAVARSRRRASGPPDGSGPDGPWAGVMRGLEGTRSDLVPALQRTQAALGYVPPEALTSIARWLKLSESEVFGVASFYAQFRFKRPARHSIKVCLGTACHVRGGQEIVDALTSELGIEPGETTPDHRVGLETVNCVGACALGPLMIIDGEYFGQVTPDRATLELKRRTKR